VGGQTTAIYLGKHAFFDVVTRLGALYADLLRFSDWCSGREKSVEREQRRGIELPVKSKENNLRTKLSKTRVQQAL
jgi:hypothetical protein